MTIIPNIINVAYIGQLIKYIPMALIAPNPSNINIIAGAGCQIPSNNNVTTSINVTKIPTCSPSFVNIVQAVANDISIVSTIYSSLFIIRYAVPS